MKQKLIGVMDTFLMIALLWGMSFLNGRWVYWAQTISFVLLGLLGIFLLVLFIQCKRRHLLMILWLLLMGNAVQAADFTACVGLKKELLNACIYRELATPEVTTALCSAAEAFKPAKVNYSQLERKKRGQITGRANQIMNAYESLDVASRNSVSSEAYKCAQTYSKKYLEWLQKNAGDATDQVKTVPMILADSNIHCWTCDIILVFFVIIEHMVVNSLVSLSSIALMMLEIMLGFWIVFRVMRLVLNLSTAATFFQDLLKQILIALLAGIVLVNLSGRDAQKQEDYQGSMLQGVFQLTVMPIMDIVLYLGEGWQDLMMLSPIEPPESPHNFSFFDIIRAGINSADMPEAFQQTYCGDLNGNTEEVRQSINGRIAYFFGVGDGGLDPGLERDGYYVSSNRLALANRIFPGEVIQGFLCMTQRVYNQLMPLTAVGQVIVADQVHKLANLFNLKKWWPRVFKGELLSELPSIKQLIVGSMIYLPTLFFMWIIAFEILDIFLRLMFVFVLVPIWITCAVFSVTRFYAKQTIKLFFSLMVDFLAIIFATGIVIGLTQRFLPEKVLKNLVCWIFDVTGELSKAYGGSQCVINSVQQLHALGKELIEGKMNPSYVEHLYQAVTGEYGIKYILVLWGMYYFGKRIFSSCRETFRSLLGATTGVSIGGQMFGRAVMAAQETTRRGFGYVLTSIPFGDKILGRTRAFFGKVTDSIGSVAFRPFSATADLVGKSGDVISKGGYKLGGASKSLLRGSRNMFTRSFSTMISGFSGGIVSGLLGVGLGVVQFVGGVAGMAVGALSFLLGYVGGALVKASSWLSKWSIKIGAALGLKTIGASVRQLGNSLLSSLKQFFYYQGNIADKKRKARDAKARRNKIRKYYGH
ncbi:MAG: type IV secretion system protein [Alphaproteobacteria bacterium]|nr:type IV secretion system protein [Alphaproteobacteria bacterium]